MPSPLKAFFWVTVMITLFGVLTGTLNLLNPQAVHIPFGPNGESAEGVDGLLAATLSSLVLGMLFGLFAALLAWVTARGVSKAGRKPAAPDGK